MTLTSFELRYLGPGPAEIRQRPHTVQVLEGEMDYWYRDEAQTGWILPTTAASWGSLKSVYR